MRYKLIFQLEDNVLTVNYRECLISFLKSALKQYSGGSFYKEFYGECKQKSFSFAVKLPRCSFVKDKILLDGMTVEMYLSSYDLSDMVILYNALNGQRYKEFPLPMNNKLTLKNIFMEHEKDVRAGEMICQTAMPLAVRDHDRSTNKDKYYLPDDERFLPKLKEIVLCQLDSAGFDRSLLEGFDFAMPEYKKSVVKFKDTYVTGALGLFCMKGCPELIRYLYQAGVGSRRSEGFGYFNIVK
ncbi:CRISPR-associated endoribonuclease Cas6 [Ruminococcus sp. Marseille-P6503]|uniref:CRISPR-associated endoribonuclease Cas6 n=1 Tax=Ruminococcus sp. Marseille-P6503 TaxID=2364796 RepID=UPI000F53CDA2|nr:CRISPR-associated endoribonuclease Cas6 [Ruminococcus sp. Marseille-P6503]